MINERMQAAIQELQDSMVVMAHIEKIQSEMLRDHAKHFAQIEEFRRRTERNLVEITDKVIGLIGYVAVERPDGGAPQ
jgi:hypothetical protein